ncbi:MAG: peptide ABC transporter substrate-binding protein, partial [Phormidesmis sp.]
SWWLCSEIASMENSWQKSNNARYCNEEYDKVWQQASKELDSKKRALLFQRLNTILQQDVAVIPLVRRPVTNGISDRITGVDPTPWDASTWDIGTWELATQPEAQLEESPEKTDETTGAASTEETDAAQTDIAPEAPDTKSTENEN